MVVKIVGAATIAKVEHDVFEEFKYQHALSFRDCASVLDAYSYSIRKRPQLPQLGYMYMDYAAFGDLWTLMGRIRKEPK